MEKSSEQKFSKEIIPNAERVEETISFDENIHKEQYIEDILEDIFSDEKEGNSINNSDGLREKVKDPSLSFEEGACCSEDNFTQNEDNVLIEKPIPFKESDEGNIDYKRETKEEMSTAPEKKNLKLKKIITLFLVFALLIGSCVFYAFDYQFKKAGTFSEKQVVFIEPNKGIKHIAHLLKKHGLISSEGLFVYNVRLRGHTSRLKAGEYEIPAHSSMQNIMNILLSGKTKKYTFTVPEGLTVKQVFNRLGTMDSLRGPLPKKMPIEGSLLADTIQFERGTERKKIIEHLEKAQQNLVDEIWKNRDPDLPLKNKQELVTLASIVEKETGKVQERPLIAGVFYNRLKKHMRLQSDPTIIYGIFGGDGKPANRAIYRSDLQKETPYNTYKIKGLPPTPIANPGKASLEAVAHPAKTDALYFVADGTGGHVFSNNLEEHVKKVKRWREIKKKLQ